MSNPALPAPPRIYSPAQVMVWLLFIATVSIVSCLTGSTFDPILWVGGCAGLGLSGWGLYDPNPQKMTIRVLWGWLGTLAGIFAAFVDAYFFYSPKMVGAIFLFQEAIVFGVSGCCAGVWLKRYLDKAAWPTWRQLPGELLVTAGISLLGSVISSMIGLGLCILLLFCGLDLGRGATTWQFLTRADIPALQQWAATMPADGGDIPETSWPKSASELGPHKITMVKGELCLHFPFSRMNDFTIKVKSKNTGGSKLQQFKISHHEH